MKNGRLYNGDNLNQIYPLQKKSENFNWQEKAPSSLPGVLINKSKNYEKNSFT
jgi:hypothetical protein